MPISAHKSKRAKISLEIDKDIPEPERPVFLFRFISNAERGEVRANLEAAGKFKDDESQSSSVCAAIRPALIGWENQTTAFAPAGDSIDPLRRILTLTEIWELAFAFLDGITVQERDIKNSQPPLADATEKSASDAGAGNAPIPQQ